MQPISRYGFISGILLFLIYERSLNLLLSLNDVCLFILEMRENYYLGGFVVSIILTNLIVVGLYKTYLKSENHKLYGKRLLIGLALLVLTSLGLNYFLGTWGMREMDKSLQDVYYRYYDSKNIIYFINTTILLILYSYIFFKKEKVLSKL